MKLKRKNIRLKNYDYSKEGYYYITICIKNRKEILSKIGIYNAKIMPTPTNAKIPIIVSTLKRLTNKEIENKIWQRNYYEHIIRNEKEYYEIIKYMQNNPVRWIEKEGGK